MLSSLSYAVRVLVLLLVALLSACSTINEPTPQLPRASEKGVDFLAASSLKSFDEVLYDISRLHPLFGGAYYNDEGVFTIRVTLPNRASPVAKARIAQIIADRFGDDVLERRFPLRLNPLTRDTNVDALVNRAEVIYEEADYAYKDLFEWRARLTEIFQFSEVVSSATNGRLNRIVIGLENLNNISAIEAWVKNAGVPLDAVIFEERVLPEPQQTLDSRLRPLRGGARIGPKGCSLGLPVINGGVVGIITNSHCTSDMFKQTSTVITQPWNSDQIAVESKDPPYFTHAQNSSCPRGLACRWSDSSFARATISVPTGSLGTVWKTRQVNSGDTTIRTEPDSRDEYTQFFKMAGKVNMSQHPNQFVGNILHKVGARNGWTSGRITEECRDSRMAAQVDGRTVFVYCNITTEMLSGGGDSGSPVFSRRLVNGMYYHEFYGLHWGSGGGVAYASPLHMIERDLGTLTVR